MEMEYRRVNEVDHNAILALTSGERVRLSNIYRYAEYALGFIDLSFKEGKLFGQRLLFDDNEMILYYIGIPKSERALIDVKTDKLL